MPTETQPLSDQGFLHQFHNCELDSQHFKHRGHLRLAWLVIRQQQAQQRPIEDAVEAICTGIQRYATSLGATDKFHHTLTEAIVRIMSDRMQCSPSEDFNTFLTNNPDLVSDLTGVLRRHYSDELLNSPAARKGFVAPDIQPLPGAAAHACVQ